MMHIEEASQMRQDEVDVDSNGEAAGRSQAPGSKKSRIRISQNARESIVVLGQGLKQLFQPQRRLRSQSTLDSSCSSSCSSLVSAGGILPSANEENYRPECDSASVAPSAKGMRRGTSLQSRRSKGSGSGSGDRDPLLRGSPQALHRRYTHDPQQHVSRRRSSSTTETSPSSPAPGGEVGLSSGYQSTEESDRIDRLEVSGLGQTPLAVSCGADGSFTSSEDGTPDPQRTKQAIAQLQQKILKLTEQIKIEQTARDDNVAEYLKLANNADKQQSTRIKQVFEKKNQKSAQTIQQLQRKLEHYHRKLREVEHNGIPRQPKDVLRDMHQGLKDVGAKVTGFSEGVVDSVKGGLSSFSQATHSAAGAVVSKPREIASLIRNKFGSADNIPSLKDSLDDPTVEEGVTGLAGRSLASAGHHLQSSPKYGSEDDCSSATSGSAGAISITGAPGGPPSSKGNTLERSESSSLDMLLQEVQELREGQARLEESLDGLKRDYQQDYTVVMQSLQEERFRCERLEDQLNDLTDLHQNEILNLKQELASMEEKIAYQSYERARDIQEALEACQTRISKMELQQQQQQAVQLEGLENATARTLLGKLINVLLALMAVLLVFVSTVANCVVPLMKTRSRSLSTFLLILLLAFLWRNWDALSGYTHHALQPPGGVD
ncbi:transmembrane and coiled-coil domains protein 1 isoform 1-T1 [Synchiropus picturatus]